MTTASDPRGFARPQLTGGPSSDILAQWVREAFLGAPSAPVASVPLDVAGAVPNPSLHASSVPHPIGTPTPAPLSQGKGAGTGAPLPQSLDYLQQPSLGAGLDGAPSAGVSPIRQHHGRLDAAGDYYYLARAEPASTPQSSALPGPAGSFEPPVLPAASVPAAPATRPLTGGAPIPAGFDVHAVRRDFPALHQEVNGHPLIWLDNAATTHKPQSVIDATSEFYSRHNSNIHRAAHTLAARSTDLFEGARDKLRDFVGAASSREIVFLRGTTEAINLVANSYGQAHISAGDEIIVTRIEHHANIVPWQLLAQRTGAVLKVAPVDERGELQLDRFAALLGPRTKFVSVTHVANSLGTVVPVEAIIALAHAHGVPVLVDAAQSSPHLPIDVRALDADFLVLSGHKIFGPTGIGILYGKERHLDAMPPWQGGGHMIRKVTFEQTSYQGLPEKFEAGTPDIAGAVGLGAAVDYVTRIGLPAIAAYEHALLEYATERLAEVKGLRLIGTAPVKASVLSFVLDDFEPEQVSRHLDRHGIATRSGHHCAQPALAHFGLEQTVRASLAFYNTREDVDALIRGLERLPKH